MKKLISVLLILLLLLSLPLSALATESEAPWVVDNAGLLTAEEQSALMNKIQTLRDELELEIVIVTTYGTGSKNVQVYADDFYDQNGYGYGKTDSGILLLLDMEAREWYMSTCGEAIYIFTDYGLSLLGDELVRWLSQAMYYEGFDLWVDSLSSYVDAYRNGTPVDGYVQPDDYESPNGDEIVYYDEPLFKHPFLVALIVGLVSALITVIVMVSKMNTAKLQTNAGNYLKKGSFRMHRHTDQFLYSQVTKRSKPKESTSSGGSSVHRSSGGVSHGGRGGKF